jgi:hypothetical protein
VKDSQAPFLACWLLFRQFSSPDDIKQAGQLADKSVVFDQHSDLNDMKVLALFLIGECVETMAKSGFVLLRLKVEAGKIHFGN